MDEKRAFTERLLRTLKECGMPASSPTRLALDFNLHHHGKPVTVQAVRKWLNGSAIPAQDKIVTLAQWLGVSAEWLRFGGATVRTANQESPRYRTHDMKLCNDLMKLNAEHRTVVRALVASLLRLQKD